jgi:hypothetical protein
MALAVGDVYVISGRSLAVWLRAADARDLAVINANADRLNAEAEDVLDYQGER